MTSKDRVIGSPPLRPSPRLHEIYERLQRRGRIGEALKGRRRDNVILSVKFGAQRAPDGSWIGIAITAYGVLSRGLISGHMQGGIATTGVHGQGDFRGHSPRFQGENLTKNLALADALRAEAGKLSLSTAQAAIAWALATGADIVPVIGARTRERLAETLGALDKPLTPDAVVALEAAVPKDAAAGDRYPAMAMARLDSERRASRP